MDSALTVALIELILKYGPEIAIKLIKGLQVDNPTVEQIEALKVKDPEEYFNGG